MDKKSKYAQSSTKGTGPADAKKNQDVVGGGKVFPKTNRRQEPSSTGLYATKHEPQSKKANVQKKRSFDKRPKPKGQYHGGAKEDTKVGENEAAEFGSVMVPGSKKQNLNHLLNFHYAPRDTTTNSGGWNYGRPHGNHNNNRWLPPVQRHKYNKEQFLQANCQFVVNNDGDYTAYLADPDSLVDWKLIEQIRIQSSENLACPICLCPPVAGKMTRCGHVYCWPCILHYLALSEKAVRKCPICYESVHKSDLKSVVVITKNHLSIGDQVKLRLMRRERGSLIAVPVQETATPIPTNFISFEEIYTQEIMSKLLLASVSDIASIIESERVQLKLELMEDPNSTDNCFVEQALVDLSEREKQIFATTNTNNIVDDQIADGACEAAAIETNVEGKECLNQSENSLESVEVHPESLDDNQAEENACGEAPGARALSKFFYFYQAEDGQHLYLHAMNVKMLELQYGSLENCPRTIWGKILEKEAGSFTEELRRRMRYLHHLPLTSTFEIAEIELAPPLITEDILGYFSAQIGNREKRRGKREREERKREKKITAEENKRMGKFATPKVHLESHKHFPEWQPDAQSSRMSASSPPESLAPSSIASSPSRGSFIEENISTEYNFPQETSVEHNAGPSFAQMLRNTGSRVGSGSVAWPSISRPEHSSNRSPVAKTPGNVFDEDDYAGAPSYNQSFGDVLAQALDRTDLLDNGKSANSSRKKKKKCKSTILFATNMPRAS